MNYQQTIDYLYNTLPMFSSMGSAAYKKDLTNTLALCEALGNPHKKFKSIHVGGTNGKGSVSHMLAAVFQTAGYKTGLYTSPHLYDFRERIRVDGEMCEEAFVCAFVEKMKPLVETIKPSFFEITVAMAFEYFAQQQVDIAIIEVGLGGRLDSTNVITPELSVITNIGWDHMNMLGDTLEQIAFEKAGIIKPEIPVVIGEKELETEEVFRNVAAERQAPIYFAEDNFHVSGYKVSNTNIQVSVEDISGKTQNYELDLPGIYQTKNVLAVLQSLTLLKRWDVNESQIQAALKNVKRITGLHGRWELIHEKPRLILEVAHNQDGIRQMFSHLRQMSFDQLHIVFGVVKDKDLKSILKMLPPSARYYFTQAHIPRALPAAELQEQAMGFSLNGDSFADVNAAIQNALMHAGANDVIIVCGSIFLVAEVDRASITQPA